MSHIYVRINANYIGIGGRATLYTFKTNSINKIIFIRQLWQVGNVRESVHSFSNSLSTIFSNVNLFPRPLIKSSTHEFNIFASWSTRAETHWTVILCKRVHMIIWNKKTLTIIYVQLCFTHTHMAEGSLPIKTSKTLHLLPRERVYRHLCPHILNTCCLYGIVLLYLITP